jgi:hypothetical protein
MVACMEISLLNVSRSERNYYMELIDAFDCDSCPGVALKLVGGGFGKDGVAAIVDESWLFRQLSPNMQVPARKKEQGDIMVLLTSAVVVLRLLRPALLCSAA